MPIALDGPCSLRVIAVTNEKTGEEMNRVLYIQTTKLFTFKLTSTYWLYRFGKMHERFGFINGDLVATLVIAREK